jgi:hypothetical protein
MTLKLSKEEAPMGYSFIGLFKTQAEAEKWHAVAIKAGKKNPFWLNYDGEYYILFWKKQKNSKKCGKGFKGG